MAEDARPLIFISYWSRDEVLAEAFKKYISSDFLDFPKVFLAAHLDPGVVWPEKIREAILGASVVCILRSERTQTRWVSMEVGAAWVTGATMIPLCYGGLKKDGLSDILSMHMAVDIRSKADLKKLYHSIAAKIHCSAPDVSQHLINEIERFHTSYQPDSPPELYASKNIRRININYDVKWDKTVKAIAPITGTLIWTIPGRGQRPQGDIDLTPIGPREHSENECVFCETRYEEISPEIWRIYKDGDTYKQDYSPTAEMVLNRASPRAEFRRVSNMFPILSYDYWSSNYGMRPDHELVERYNRYVATPIGKEHIEVLVRKKQGRVDAKYLGREFFYGSHELIIARRHFLPSAQYKEQTVGSGDLTQDEHYQYFKITMDTAKDLYRHNAKVKYVAVFQNWRRLSGATVRHLHKQVVGIDEYGLPLTRYIEAFKQGLNPFEEIMDWARGKNLVLASNDHAMAFIDVGHRYPTIAIFAKNGKNIQEQTPEEVRGVSDLVHACHAAIGSDVAINEEWYYCPPDINEEVPWHILILYRRSTQAGFEHATRIYINDYPPEDLRSDVLARLVTLGEEGNIPGIEIGS